MNGGRHNENIGNVVARHSENIETIVVSEMEREIDVEYDDCAWMVQYATLAPLPPVVATAIAFVVVSASAALSVSEEEMVAVVVKHHS